MRIEDEVIAMDSSGMEMEAQGSQQAQQRFEKREGKKAAVQPYATRRCTCFLFLIVVTDELVFLTLDSDEKKTG